MKKRKKVLANSCLGIRSPIGTGMLWWLFLDRLGASEWVYGLLFGLLFLWLVAYVDGLLRAEPVDIFKE